MLYKIFITFNKYKRSSYYSLTITLDLTIANKAFLFFPNNSETFIKKTGRNSLSILQNIFSKIL